MYNKHKYTGNHTGGKLIFWGIVIGIPVVCIVILIMLVAFELSGFNLIEYYDTSILGNHKCILTAHSRLGTAIIYITLVFSSAFSFFIVLKSITMDEKNILKIIFIYIILFIIVSILLYLGLNAHSCFSYDVIYRRDILELKGTYYKWDEVKRVTIAVIHIVDEDVGDTYTTKRVVYLCDGTSITIMGDPDGSEELDRMIRKYGIDYIKN